MPSTPRKRYLEHTRRHAARACELRLDGYHNRRRQRIHADFGSGTWNGGPIGIPFVTVPGTQPRPYPSDVQVILRAMKKYGIMLADNGSAWFISGKPDSRWNNGYLQALGQLRGSNFEAIDATVLRIEPNSGAAAPSAVAVRVSVNGTAGGDAVAGQIDGAGRYVAPGSVPSPAGVSVRATSTASPSSSGSAAVTILPLPAISVVSPSSFPVGNFSLTVTGAAVHSRRAEHGQHVHHLQSERHRRGNPTVGTIPSSGLYRAPGSVPNRAGVTVSATAAGDQTKTATASVTVSRR